MSRDFNGSGRVMTTGVTANPTTRTYSGWYKRTASTLANYTVWDTATGDHDIFFFDGGNTDQWQYWHGWSGQNGEWQVDGDDTDFLDVNNWHHVAMTYDGGSTGNDPVFYKDGASQSIVENNNPTGTRTSGTTAVRVSNGTNYFRGLIAHFARWNVILDADEITALSNGVRPWRIRPHALDIYHLWGPLSAEPNFVGGNSATITSATLAADPDLVTGRMFPWWGDVPFMDVAVAANTRRYSLPVMGVG